MSPWKNHLHLFFKLDKPIEMSDFSFDLDTGNLELHESGWSTHEVFRGIVDDCELMRKKFIETNDKRYWRALIQTIPSASERDLSS